LLLDTTAALYENPITDTIIDALGIDKNSQGHRFYIQDGVDSLIKARRSAESSNSSGQAYNEARNSFLDRVSILTDQILSGNEDPVSPENKTLYDAIKTLIEEE
jgi:hypothetical protein